MSMLREEHERKKLMLVRIGSVMGPMMEHEQTRHEIGGASNKLGLAKVVK